MKRAHPCQTHHLDNELNSLIETLRNLPEIKGKRAIKLAAELTDKYSGLPLEKLYELPGDDCAAFRDPQGYRLLAMEGMLPGFVGSDPRAAGWSSVMVNISDIAAMGGRAEAVVNAFWHHDEGASAEILFHIKRACDVFGVHFAGGHSSIGKGFQPGLAVAITGHANQLLSCHHLAPNQKLYLLTDLDGSWHKESAYWGVVGGKTPEQIRKQWQLPAELADEGHAVAAKDISNGGILGTLVMMLELTGCGASVDLNSLPRPNPEKHDDDLLRWLRAFQSFGFLLAVEPSRATALEKRMAESHLTCQCIGDINNTGKISLGYHRQQGYFWDLHSDSLTNMGGPNARCQF
ncbi:sll0787 family AIR synthase-like protein [Alcanivorax jadensis]|uniref:sll0787 family AIR synthase-like protein n=1 Tax=Alcanivorax jadensis TaxID=64988 RepID=UPI00240A0736|nr:sll0787 family AIR synthase-like protein [Alcanivorax jadensis]MDF1639064.1 sll0787 family AIR synthase-like protein [Alcanivorax jadensis]